MAGGRRLMFVLAASAGAVGLAAACGSSSNRSPATGSADSGAPVDVDGDGAGDEKLLASDPCALPSSGGAPPATVDAFIAALRSAQCARMVRCGLIDPSDLAACPAAIEYTTGGDGDTLASLLHDEATGASADWLCAATFACADGFWCRGFDPAGVAGTCEAPHAMPTCVASSGLLGSDGCLGLVETCADAGSCTRLGHDGSPCAGPGGTYCAYIPATWCPLGANLPPSVNQYDCRSVGEAGAPCILYNDCLAHVCNAGHCG